MKFIKKLGDGELTVKDNTVVETGAAGKADIWADEFHERHVAPSVGLPEVPHLVFSLFFFKICILQCKRKVVIELEFVLLLSFQLSYFKCFRFSALLLAGAFL